MEDNVVKSENMFVSWIHQTDYLLNVVVFNYLMKFYEMIVKQDNNQHCTYKFSHFWLQ